ncbi:MAG: acyl-CoA reductase [Bacteroidia bacterium]
MGYTVKQLSPVEQDIDIRKIVFPDDTGYSLSVFDELFVEFFNDFSRLIMSDKNINRIPAITALAFWLRKTNIRELIDENKHIANAKNYKANPIGNVFHICPSNVDIMFLYSLTISLLTGNKNVVRISKKSFHPNILELFNIINQLLKNEKYSELKKYICIITYEHETEINEYLSMSCDARIIWGGDNTINLFKNFKTKPSTKDIVFADRFSLSIIHTGKYKNENEETKKKIAWDFFNDSYTFDQKGCSSPQMIFVYGNDADNDYFKNDFYTRISVLAESTYITDITSLASLKLNTITSDIIDNKTDQVIHSNNYVTFVNYTESGLNIHSCGGGYFYIKIIRELDDLRKSLSKKTQTLSYYGFDENEIAQIASLSNGIGIDRIVPIGKALQFSYIWDGYNLIDELVSKKLILRS